MDRERNYLGQKGKNHFLLASSNSSQNIKTQPPPSSLTQGKVQWQWQPFYASVFPPSLSAEWVDRDGSQDSVFLAGVDIQANAWQMSVPRILSSRGRSAWLICLVNMAQVNLTTKRVYKRPLCCCPPSSPRWKEECKGLGGEGIGERTEQKSWQRRVEMDSGNVNQRMHKRQTQS